MYPREPYKECVDQRVTVKCAVSSTQHRKRVRVLKRGLSPENVLGVPVLSVALEDLIEHASESQRLDLLPAQVFVPSQGNSKFAVENVSNDSVLYSFGAFASDSPISIEHGGQPPPL
eukprot:964269-Prorocentrum_minimum.AAC.3